MTHRLHLTVGPVQVIISQARRTRDLWAGSFLVSWLTMRAAVAIEQAFGAAALPEWSRDAAFQALLSGDGAAILPYRANSPNHFVAHFDNAGAAASAGAVGKAAIEAAWLTLCKAVHDRFLTGLLDEEQAACWQAAVQPDLLFETIWVVAAPGMDADEVLAERKRWRRFAAMPPVLSRGDRCTLMPDWPEMSGYSRITSQGRKAQTEFWNAAIAGIGAHLGGGRQLEIRDGERLSAPALIKRLYARLPAARLGAAIGWQPEQVTKSGRLRLSYMPSTAYLAAAHWLARAAAVAPDLCQQFVNALPDSARAYRLAEQFTGLSALKGAGEIAFVDGRLFFRDALNNKREVELDDESRGRLDGILRQLASIEVAGERLGGPQPYYALLAMDGDHMAELVAKKPAIRQGLSAFPDAARRIVEAHSGRLIYAGGDDLLALVPLEDGLAAACELQETFVQLADCAEATMSAGLVFAHQNAPLRAVVEEGRRLLEGVAKKDNGRDSLAVSVFRVGGTAFEWATTFTARKGGVPPAKLAELASRCHTPEVRPLASNRLVYAMRDQLGPFFTAAGSRRLDVISKSEMLHIETGTLKGLIRDVGGEAMWQVSDADLSCLIDVAVSRYRRKGSGGYALVEMLDDRLCLDALMLFRFLATQWQKRDIPTNGSAKPELAA